MDNKLEQAAAEYSFNIQTLIFPTLPEELRERWVFETKHTFKAGAEWDREQMKSYIEKRMKELWEKLPDANKSTFTNEEVKLLGKYMMLEELDDMLNNGKE